ncbi:MAG TPA: FAD-dependent oxidoreductase [Thermoanaerobaculia bacterium]|nr:FAD-dependent oxidoreductase [Thermoanaerobaculia bacterium]
MPRRLVVVGAGPIGLAAATGARERGFEVTVLEAGEVGASLRTWGATRFFTPLRMNVHHPIDDDALLTGPEYIDRVLVPLAAKLDVKTNTRVVSIARRGLTRTDYAGHPLRAERPFRIFTNTDEVFEADVVLDASGSASPIPLHARGTADAGIIRTLGELDARKDDLRGRRVLVIGHGHSAANALLVLRDAGAEITWAVRTANRNPCEEIANDPLPERQRVAAAANALAQTIRVERRASIESIDVTTVQLTGGRSVEADMIVAMTGYRPANDFTTELALETSPVSEGGARLYRAISKITDCLCVPTLAKEDFASGEPNYFFIGARAYGRSRTFLLQTGFAQVETILESLHD